MLSRYCAHCSLVCVCVCVFCGLLFPCVIAYECGKQLLFVRGVFQCVLEPLLTRPRCSVLLFRPPAPLLSSSVAPPRDHDVPFVPFSRVPPVECCLSQWEVVLVCAFCFFYYIRRCRNIVFLYPWCNPSYSTCAQKSWAIYITVLFFCFLSVFDLQVQCEDEVPIVRAVHGSVAGFQF